MKKLTESDFLGPQKRVEFISAGGKKKKKMAAAASSFPKLCQKLLRERASSYRDCLFVACWMPRPFFTGSSSAKPARVSGQIVNFDGVTSQMEPEIVRLPGKLFAQLQLDGDCCSSFWTTISKAAASKTFEGGGIFNPAQQQQ